MAAYIIDGDKGGVGKSFVARAVADYLITHKGAGKIVVIDCDPSNADVVGGDGFYEGEIVGGLGGCKNFCVNGHLAGDCRPSRESRNDRKQRTH